MDFDGRIDLSGRAAIVTGASRGIGRRCAIALARCGASVLVNCRSRKDAAAEVAEEIRSHGAAARVHAGDLSAPGTASELIAAAMEEFGRLDILVNNAGILRHAPVMLMKDESWEETLGVNLTSAARCCREAVRPMMRNRWGRIINISSVAAILGDVQAAAYCASKAGLIGLTRALARELAASGITVNAVAPGYVETDMIADMPDKKKEALLKRIPQRRFAGAEDIAPVVCFLASDLASCVTGQVWNVDCGLTI